MKTASAGISIQAISKEEILNAYKPNLTLLSYVTSLSDTAQFNRVIRHPLAG